MKNSNPLPCHSCGVEYDEEHKDDCEFVAIMSEYADEMIDAWRRMRAAQLTFRTIFLTQIHSCYAEQDEADAWMAREEMLPFAPVPKTIFTQPDGWVAWAVEVQWDGEMFVVYSKRNTEIFDRQAQHRTGRGISEIVREYEEQGWTFIGNGINPPIENLIKKDDADAETT